MGAGKGRTKRARSAVRSSPRLKYSLGDEGRMLSVRLLSVDSEEKGKQYTSPFTQLWISGAYDNAEEIASRVNDFFVHAPERLRGAAERIFILGGYAPPNDGLVEVSACAEGNNLFVWRAVTNDNQPGIHQDMLVHELAHAAGHNGGPPLGIRSEWERARGEDQLHGAKIADSLTDGKSPMVEVGLENTVLLLGGAWATTYACNDTRGREQNEDWAESVELYSAWGRFPNGVLTVEGRDFRFQDLYPHRARIIAEFLG